MRRTQKRKTSSTWRRGTPVNPIQLDIRPRPKPEPKPEPEAQPKRKKAPKPKPAIVVTPAPDDGAVDKANNSIDMESDINDDTTRE